MRSSIPLFPAIFERQLAENKREIKLKFLYTNIFAVLFSMINKTGHARAHDSIS